MENESKCHEETEHEHADLLVFALLAMIILFAAKYIVYPDVVVPYIIPHISSRLQNLFFGIIAFAGFSYELIGIYVVMPE